MKGYYIRDWNASDIGRMLEIERLCFPDPWTEDMFRAEFNNPITRYYVSELSGQDVDNSVSDAEDRVYGSDTVSESKIIAYIGFLCVAGECQINNVAVHPDYRKYGIGSELLELVINTTEDEGISLWTLEVRVGNAPAIGLYEKFGFKIVGERPNYYDDGADAILMTRETADDYDNDN